MSSDESDRDSESTAEEEEDEYLDPYEQAAQLRKEGRKVPRRLRTHDLKIFHNHCSSWSVADGLRELIQNFLDGMCFAHGLALEDIHPVQKTTGGEGKKTWTETWTFRQSDENGRVLGMLRWNITKRWMKLINEGITLEENILLTGFSKKRHKRNQIGSHGEGMKIGILRLLVDDAKVKYSTGKEAWRFFIREARGYKEKTLHYKTSDLKGKKVRTSTEVFVQNLQPKHFDRNKYLKLSDSVTVVEQSKCYDGALLDGWDKPKPALFAKGLFVFMPDDLNYSINLSNCHLNRDREVVTGRNGLAGDIAKVWKCVITNEHLAEDTPSTWTARLVKLAQVNPQCLETLCLRFLPVGIADYIVYFLRKTEGDNMFPVPVEDDKSCRDARSVLKRKPYKCSKEMYEFLLKSPLVKSVADEIKNTFIAAPTLSTKFCARDGPSLCVAYVTAVFGSAFTLVFKKNDSVDCILLDKSLYISASFVIMSMKSKNVPRMLVKLENALWQKLNEDKRVEARLASMKFLTSAHYREFVHEKTPAPPGNAQSPVADRNEQTANPRCTQPQDPPSSKGVSQKEKPGPTGPESNELSANDESTDEVCPNTKGGRDPHEDKQCNQTGAKSKTTAPPNPAERGCGEPAELIYEAIETSTADCAIRIELKHDSELSGEVLFGPARFNDLVDAVPSRCTWNRGELQNEFHAVVGDPQFPEARIFVQPLAPAETGGSESGLEGRPSKARRLNDSPAEIPPACRTPRTPRTPLLQRMPDTPGSLPRGILADSRRFRKLVFTIRGTTVTLIHVLRSANGRLFPWRFMDGAPRSALPSELCSWQITSPTEVARMPGCAPSFVMQVGTQPMDEGLSDSRIGTPRTPLTGGSVRDLN